MADLTENISPVLNKDQVKDILKNDYGFINGKLQELDGYDDKNYYITVRINYWLNVYLQIKNMVYWYWYDK